MIIKGNTAVQVIGYVLIAFYFFGMVFPDLWWGTNYVAFLPDFWKWILLFCSVMLIVLPRYKDVSISFQNFKKYKKFSKLGVLFVLLSSFLMGALFFYYQIAFDDYGDAFIFREHLGDTVSILPDDVRNSLFSFDLKPSSGRKSVLFFYNYLSYAGGFTIAQVFKWVAVISGFVYVLSWLLFVRYYLKSLKWKIIMSVIGLLAPFTQIYYGHTESYALVFTFFISWILLLLVFYKTNRKILLWFLLILLFVCIKIHPLCFLLIPVWILTFLSHSYNMVPWVKKLLTWKGVLSWIIVPLLCFGAILYFFVFKDYNDPRFLEGVKDVDRLFLPLLSPDAPLDRYNLLGWNHIFDYFNLMISWSSPALLILTGIIIKFRKKIDWNAPEIIVIGLLIILSSSLLFMLNPLVSMPMDWDLFSFVAPILIIFVVVLLSKVEYEMSTKLYMPTIAIILMLSSPFFIVNSNTAMLSDRLASVGVRVYKTYYLHSNRIIINALNLQPNTDGYLSKKSIILKKLKPFAIPGKDPLYANLLMDDGFYHLNVSKDYFKAVDRLSEAVYYFPSIENQHLLLDAEHKLNPDRSLFDPSLTKEEFEKEGVYLMRELGDFKGARNYFEQVLEIYPEDPLFIMYAMESCFQMGDFIQAYYYSTGLVIFKFPDENKSYRIATHCALEAKLYKKAKEQAALCIDKFPEDKLMLQVYNRLINNDHLDEIRFLFVNK